MRANSHLSVATLTAAVLLASISLTWAQIAGGNRQVGSPTRDSDAGLGTRAPTSAMRRMQAGTTQQRARVGADGNVDFSSRPQRTLMGNSGSAAGGRPRNTTLNPAARDPLTRNPALLDPVSGVPATGPAQRAGAFDSTGRSLIQGRGMDDATFVDEFYPPDDVSDLSVIAGENVPVEPQATGFDSGDDPYDFSNNSLVPEATSSAAEPLSTVNSAQRVNPTFPGADSAQTGNTTPGASRTAVVRSAPDKALVYGNRRLLLERLGLNLDPNVEAPTLVGVTRGSWAEVAGFQTGDRIVGIGGQSVYGLRDLASFLRTHLSGRTTIDIERKGRALQLELSLASLTRRLQSGGQARPQAAGPNLTDPSAAVTSGGRRIAGTAAEAVRAARLRAEQPRQQTATEQ